ncbi:hypothetical protein BWZ20_06090 [Winogradskyella sp. J14-2]|uniref:cysteine dioxygenase n=1 Tax=Winogradskyella sp. J14-2 TaxID=1936080 RepID=UPI0009729D30|nr:cysteine dioxygenase family protein [Winogradskyella sp. J14-2]APY07897.1 hypothetical protein BWZ20_06090 [Winogradskyella sp. J14-2]
MKTQALINTLINLLTESSKKDYTNILLNFNFQDIDFSEIEHWKPHDYTRNCFYKDKNFELILICWDKGQKTAIHNHNGEECWVYLLEGELEEDFYELDDSGQLEYKSSQILRPNEITKSEGHDVFHSLGNSTKSRAISLHVYAKPIAQSLTFDDALGKLVDKKLSYDTYKGVVSSEVI